MNEDKIALAEALAHLVGDSVVAKFIGHGYHWNVKGADFKEFHAFFEEIYSDYDSAIDTLAENIRKLGFEAPYLLTDFTQLSCLDDIDRIESGDSKEMLASLASINMNMLNDYKSAFDVATSANEQGIANFLAERIDMHAKWDWQLKATLGL
jgi:starvation-inducible DNA-binding protein